jgi:hypothetical protein
MERLLPHARGALFLQRAFEHVCKQNRDFAAIDRRRSRRGFHKPHTTALETFAPLQELEVDARNLAQDFLNLPIVAQATLDSFLEALRNIVHLGSSSRMTDR